MKQYFERKTDEDHSITGNKLIDILATYGIKAERKTIYDDIKKPNVMTYEYLNSKGKVYVIGTKDDKAYLLNAKNGKVVKEFPADTAKFHDNSTFVGAFNDDDKYEAYNMVSGKSATLDADYVNF